MKQSYFEVVSNKNIAKNVYEAVLIGDTSEIKRPGQFVNIKLDGKFLRRPISVCDYDKEKITLIYKVVGEGTREMSLLKEGERLDLLTGLGNGFDLDKSKDKPLLIGGGVGVPPLYALSKRLSEAGKSVRVILGFNSADEIFYYEKFKEITPFVTVTTADGSVGIKGFVTDAMDEYDYSHIYVCGPLVMLKAVYDRAKTDGQFSFEERMGCGFGACMGCSCKTKYGSKRICREGPVLSKEEIIW